MKDATEFDMELRIKEARKYLREKEKELDEYRRANCRVKVGDVIETARGERRKVYAVEPLGPNLVKLRCYRAKKDGTFGRAFCMEWLDDEVKVVD
jgi:hypothetical protein